MEYIKKYNQWIGNNYFDEATRQELRDLKGKDEEIKDRFYKDLEFGTGGLRGILGAGTNRINIYTIRKASQGLANYILKNKGEERGVAIAYDSRRMSQELADEVALCLAANGIKAYVFDALRPTPELSFAIREEGYIAGVVITASHNPPEYNGYKVYWEDGGQITYPKDAEIIEEVNMVRDYWQVKTMNMDDAKEIGLYNIIGKEIDDKYIEEIKKYVINPVSDLCKDMKIVYTPLHGAGFKLVPRILKEIGFENIYLVPEQANPDANFPTVSYPNPEDRAVYDLAIELAKEIDADIILATDPDADRLGIQVKKKKGKYVLFNGNMIGTILSYYIFSQKQTKGKLPANGALVKTIVSTNMVDQMAKEYGITLFEVLTGFKHIGEKIKEFEESALYEYVFGFEESYGCLIGTYARDKDAISAVMLLCEAVAYYKEKGRSIYRQMEMLYEKYGYYEEELISVPLKGIEGMKKMKDIMDGYRKSNPREIAGYSVIRIRDYLKETIVDLKTGNISPTGQEKSDVLYFELENDAWCAIRPSGTEPKLKIYFGVKANSKLAAKKNLERLVNYFSKSIPGE